MHSASADVSTPRILSLAISLALACAFVILLAGVFDLRWETNDDVAMSMVAHGYGIADQGSPRLIFSSVLWGYFVRALPSVGGLLGYSLATLLTLTLAATAISYFLLRAGAGYIITVLTLVFIFARPILYPQFTITAGLLGAGAVLGAYVFSRGGSLVELIAACCLGLLSFLVRAPEFALAMALALFLLPWRTLVRSRAAWYAAAGLAVCIAAAIAADVWAYSGPDWQAFWQRNLARAPFTDFGAVKGVLQRPEVMKRLGYSANDVRLVGNFFFADPRLMDPDALRALLGDLSTQLESTVSSASGYAAFLTIFEHPLAPLALASLLLVLVSARPSKALAWIVCLAIMLAFGAAGRPSTARVYVPLFSLLIVMLCMSECLRPRWRYGVTVCVLLGSGVLNASYLAQELRQDQPLVRLAAATKFTSPQSTVVWGGGLPFQYVFPVLTRQADIRDTRIYGLGVFTLAPFSVATADERAGFGMLTRLQTTAGVPLVATPGDQSLLNTYCIEHYGVPMRTKPLTTTPMWTVVNASCTSGDATK